MYVSMICERNVNKCNIICICSSSPLIQFDLESFISTTQLNSWSSFPALPYCILFSLV